MDNLAAMVVHVFLIQLDLFFAFVFHLIVVLMFLFKLMREILKEHFYEIKVYFVLREFHTVKGIHVKTVAHVIRMHSIHLQAHAHVHSLFQVNFTILKI